MEFNQEDVVTNVASDLIKTGISSGWEKIKDYFSDLDSKSAIEYKTAYEEYLKNTKDRYGQIKTIIYRRERKNLYSFYEAIGVEYGDKKISTERIDELLNIGSKILVTGTGGIGKSILFKHLYLNTIENTEFIPVFIELRSLNSLDNKEINLFNIIYKTLINNGFTLENKYFEYSLNLGAYIFFLDGFDEIHYDKREKITEEIKSFCEKYKCNNVFISSRPSTEFIGWSDFNEVESLPLTKKQALSLIDKIDFDESVKRTFYRELDSYLFEKYRSFASNPLLLTIMLLTFQKHASIPERLNDFYEEAFVTLFNVHDATKDSFVRDIRTGLGCEDFKLIFAYICFKSYFNGEYEFSESRLTELIGIAKNKFKNRFNFRVEDFQEDLVHSVCMLVKEGLEYRFSHRSFQEYFAAWYTCKLSDDIQQKLLNSWLKESNSIQSDSYFNMLFDLQSEKVNSIILAPAMKEIDSYYKEYNYSIEFLSVLFKGFSLSKNSATEEVRSSLYIEDQYLCNSLLLMIKLNNYEYLKNEISEEDYKKYKTKSKKNKGFLNFSEGVALYGEEHLMEMFNWFEDQLIFAVNLYENSTQFKTKKRKVSSILEEL